MCTYASLCNYMYSLAKPNGKSLMLGLCRHCNKAAAAYTFQSNVLLNFVQCMYFTALLTLHSIMISSLYLSKLITEWCVWQWKWSALMSLGLTFLSLPVISVWGMIPFHPMQVANPDGVIISVICWSTYLLIHSGKVQQTVYMKWFAKVLILSYIDVGVLNPCCCRNGSHDQDGTSRVPFQSVAISRSTQHRCLYCKANSTCMCMYPASSVMLAVRLVCICRMSMLTFKWSCPNWWMAWAVP